MTNTAPLPRVSRLALLGLGEQRELFIDNLATMLEAGLPIVSALKSLRAEATKPMQRIIDGLIFDIETGLPLWKVLARSGLFPKYTIALLKIGEEAGSLSENLQVIVDGQEKDRLLRSRIRSAMLYPILVLGLTLIVGLGVAWFILPKLAAVFGSLKLDLPLVTRILVQFGQLLARWGLIIVPGVLFLVSLVIYVVFFDQTTRSSGEWLLLHIPISARVVRQIQLSRLCFLLGTLLQSGVPITDALGSVYESTHFLAYQELIATLFQRVQAGDSLAICFHEYPDIKRLIPVTTQQLIMAAEETGKLPQTLLKISSSYEEKMDTTTKNLATTLEPALLFIVWIGVVFVAVSVILPIYSLIGGLDTATSAVSSPLPVVSQSPAAAAPPVINETVNPLPSASGEPSSAVPSAASSP